MWPGSSQSDQWTAELVLVDMQDDDDDTMEELQFSYSYFFAF